MHYGWLGYYCPSSSRVNKKNNTAPHQLLFCFTQRPSEHTHQGSRFQQAHRIMSCARLLSRQTAPGSLHYRSPTCSSQCNTYYHLVYWKKFIRDGFTSISLDCFSCVLVFLEAQPNDPKLKSHVVWLCKKMDFMFVLRWNVKLCYIIVPDLP